MASDGTDEDFFRAMRSLTNRTKRSAKFAGEFGGFGNEVDCARKQVHGRGRVRALPGANACAAEPLTPGGREIVVPARRRAGSSAK